MTEEQAELPATRKDLTDLRCDMEGGFEATRKDLTDLRCDMDGRFETMDGKIDRIAVDQSRLRGEVLDLEERIGRRIETSSSRILHAIEDFAGKTQDVDRRTLVFDSVLGKHRVQLEDHERRIQSLEGHGAPPAQP